MRTAESQKNEWRNEPGREREEEEEGLHRRLKGLVFSSLLDHNISWAMFDQQLCVSERERDVCSDIDIASSWSYYTSINISYQHGDYRVCECAWRCVQLSWFLAGPLILLTEQQSFCSLCMRQHTQKYDSNWNISQ